MRRRMLAVMEYSAKEIEQLRAVRGALQGLVARAVATTRTEPDLAELERRHAELVAAADTGDADATVAAGQALQRTLALASRWSLVAQRLAHLDELLGPDDASRFADAVRRAELVDAHRALLGAVAAGDSGAAERAVRVCCELVPAG